jgi:hypothetical protein
MLEDFHHSKLILSEHRNLESGERGGGIENEKGRNKSKPMGRAWEADSRSCDQKLKPWIIVTTFI